LHLLAWSLSIYGGVLESALLKRQLTTTVQRLID